MTGPVGGSWEQQQGEGDDIAERLQQALRPIALATRRRADFPADSNTR
ncbi:MAG: hypothetical protein O7B81_02660 [Gammaproteobacteria bacterium]|nr:hypothetical protein [Gammaproteobacteria bacterium]